MFQIIQETILPYPKSILLFFIGIINCCWILYLLIFTKNFKLKIYKAYFLFSFSVLIWVWGNAYVESKLFTSFGGNGLRYTFALVSIASSFAITAFYYISAFLKSKNNKISIYGKIFIAIMIIQNLYFSLAPGVAIIRANVFEDGTFELVQGQYFFIFYVFLVVAIFLGATNMIITLRRSSYAKKPIATRKFAHIGVGISIMYSSAIIFHMIIPYVYQIYSYSWVPPALSILDVLIVGYGILVQRFFSIKLFISKFFKSCLALVVGSVIAAICVLALEYIFPENSLRTYIHIVSFILLLYSYNKTYSWLNSHFFHHFFGITNVEYFRKTIHEFERKSIVYSTFREFENDLKSLFIEKLKIDNVRIVKLTAENKITYHNLIQYCKTNHKILVTKEIQFLETQERKAFPFSAELEKLGEICLPLYHPSKALVGFFILGQKPFDNIYYKEEIEALEHAGSHLSLRLIEITYNAELKKEVELKTKSLQEKNKKVQEQNRKITIQNREISELLIEKTKLLAQQSDFLAVTAHELRTPLSIALLHTDDMIMTNEKDPVIKEELTGMKKTLNRLKDLMDKLFNVLQFDLNKINITPEETNVSEFIERIYEDFEPIMKEKNLSFSLKNKLSRELIGNIDTVYMRQLMQNLLINAVKFTPSGKNINILAKEDRVSIIFAVSDSGEGVPDKTKHMIFEKFTSNHTMQSPGMGLGLYICKKIVELHKGEIWVEDNKPQGSTFCVKIPK